MAQPVTEVTLDRAPDDRKAYAAGFGTTDLTAVSGKPNVPAAFVQVHNAGAAAQNVVLAFARYDQTTGARLSDNVETIPVTAGQERVIPGPISELRSSGANVSVVVHWVFTARSSRNA